MKKIILYGIGNNYELFKHSLLAKHIEIVAMADTYKKGQKIDGYCVLDFSDIQNFEYDEIFVLPVNSDEIIDRLKKIGVTKEKIKDSAQINMLMMYELSYCRYIIITDDNDFLNYPYRTLENRTDTGFFLPLFWRKSEIDNERMGQESHSKHVFIVRDHCYERFSKEGTIELLKKKYNHSRWVTVLSDMCDGEYGRLATRGDDYITRLKSDFEMVITYHSGDANKYGLTYLEQTYQPAILPNNEYYDVLFVGKAKNRLQMLYDTYNRLSKENVTCKFWIDEINEKDIRNLPNIIYNQRMSYEEYLQEISRCRCLLEICQLFNESTYRYDEAVVYNKKFLFNDPSVLRRKYYNTDYMHYFNSPDEIDAGFIKKNINVDYKYQNDYSPEKFIKFIENRMMP